MAQLLSLRAGDEQGRASSLARLPLRALEAYLDGQRAWRESRWQDAFDAFGRALQVDSTFALAGFYQSLASGWIFPRPSNRGLAIARANLGRLAQRDRILIEAFLAEPADSTYALSFAKRERAAELLADRAEAWYVYADLVFHYGNVSGLPDTVTRDRAWAGFNRGLSLDPNFGPILSHRFDQALFDRDSTRLRALADSFPTILAQCSCRLIVLSRLGDSAALRDAEARLQSAPELMMGAGLAFEEGRFERGEELLEEAVRKARSGTERSQMLSNLKNGALVGGRPAKALEITRRIAAETPPGTSDQNRDIDDVLGAVFHEGDSATGAAAAERLAGRVAAVGVGSPEFADRTAALAAGLWHASKGDRARAVGLRETLESWMPHLTNPTERHMSRVAGAILDLVTADPASAPAKADALDRLMIGGPRGTAWMRNAGNLLAARALRDLGQLDRAAAAAARPDYFEFLVGSVMFRERAELALALGDTALFVRDISDYLRWRQLAEPAQRQKDDRLRADFTRVTGEPPATAQVPPR